MEAMSAVRTESTKGLNWDNRVIVLDAVDLIKADPQVGFKMEYVKFMVGINHDGNWNVVSIPPANGDTEACPKFPEDWVGLTHEALSEKITECSVICKYGELGFLEGGVPSEYEGKPDHIFKFFGDEGVKALGISDAISCDANRLRVTVGSKKSAIRVATVAADYLIKND